MKIRNRAQKGRISTHHSTGEASDRIIEWYAIEKVAQATPGRRGNYLFFPFIFSRVEEQSIRTGAVPAI
jgi:hypothetical protein